MVEEVFHVANLDPQADLTELLRERLDEYPKWFRDVAQRNNQVKNLGRLLQVDEELKELTGSVPEMLEAAGLYTAKIIDRSMCWLPFGQE